MRPVVATVVTARPWETAFVQAATTGARIRLVARIGDAPELARLIGRFDVLVVGAETPWLEPWVLSALRRFGHSSIGVYTGGDAVGARLVDDACLRFSEDTPSAMLISGAVSLGQSRTCSSDRSTTVPQTHR